MCIVKQDWAGLCLGVQSLAGLERIELGCA